MLSCGTKHYICMGYRMGYHYEWAIVICIGVWAAL